MKKLLTLATIGLATIAILGADDCSGTDDTATKPAQKANKPAGTHPDEPRPDKETPVSKPKPTMTPGQENALRAATDYLDYTAFSKSGLIDQLAQTEGYSRADATFAVNHVNANWKQQAYKSAKGYLDYTSFSLSGLVDQLAQAEGFTQAEAEYGAEKAYNGQ